jgi:hypothetical protein
MSHEPHGVVQCCGSLKEAWLDNPYLVLGTLDREPWRRGLKDPENSLKVGELPDFMHDFVEVIKVEPARWGWYPDDSKKG